MYYRGQNWQLSDSKDLIARIKNSRIRDQVFFSFIFRYVHAAVTFCETSNVIFSLKPYAGYTLNRINPMFSSILDIHQNTHSKKKRHILHSNPHSGIQEQKGHILITESPALNIVLTQH